MAVDEDATRESAAGRSGPPHDDPHGNGAGPEALVQRVQELTARLEGIADPAVRASAEELVSALIELYGEGLERIFAALDDSGGTGAEVRERLAEDGVVASLMLIHDLYPVDLEDRVVEALDSVRPYMESHGGNVELLGIEDGVARIRLEGSCEGCPASASTLELAIKQALDEAAPDLEGLLVEGALESGSAIGEGAMELPMVQVAPGRADAEPSWFDLDGLDQLSEGELTGAEIEGIGLIVARIEDSLLAYRDACPGCDGRLVDGELSEGVLACATCERRYYLPRAGRSLDEERLQLEPVPLLSGGTGVRVALAA
jgi:Fe-S cluster biogenesis protein NfuA/nitrite reductase/ring-hydroxylating ferredoxin subunit